MKQTMPALTPRETEIVQSIWNGFKNHETATRLGISAKTVEAHRAKIMAKYRVANTAQLLKALLRDGVITQGRG